MLFQHDCDNCTFHGNFFGHDVYLCSEEGNGSILGPSIIARYGNSGPDYASMPVGILQDSLQDANRTIGGTRLPGGSMNYREWIVSEYACKSTQAMIFALATIAIDKLRNPS